MRNIAVIGCGYWGKNLVRNFYNLNALHTVCDSDKEREGEYKENYQEISFSTSLQAVFYNPEIKAVAIATPAATHYSITKEALLHDKDVFVEKPLALRLKEALELVRLAGKKKRILMIDHLLQYHPAIIKLKSIINEGILGAIQYIYSNRLSIGKFRKEENILWSFAPHDISVILSLVGKMPIRVDAFGEAYLQKDIYDTTLTTLVFNDKLKAHIFVNWLHPFKEQKLVVIGTRNMAVFDDQSEEKLVLFPHKVKWVNGMPIASKAPHNAVKISSEEPLEKACSHFLNCVRKRKKPITDGREALRVLEVLNSAQNALERNNNEKR
jgi:UDP-2-acetamido-3-amino-2,3-dideoxy-glucuronate N-acetyltransferase